MSRCLQLAKNGLGSTYPNPLVGSVIVYKNRIIGEGWHYKAGEPHAEVLAIAKVSNPELLKEATLYVNLEPCSHFGKTPPCADLILEKGIRKVVIGTKDPHSKVAGRGIARLMNADCEVVAGVLENECRSLNKRFFTFHQKKRPFVILKWAQTADGFIAPKSHEKGAPVWITNRYSRQWVHKLRSEEQAILVGSNTVLQDNPRLTTRDWAGNSPMRIVLDRHLKIKEDAHVFDGSAPTLIITEIPKRDSKWVRYASIDFSTNRAEQICKLLFKFGIQSLIVEGGVKTLQTFIDANYWDEAKVFTGAIRFGDGLAAPIFGGIPEAQEILEGDQLNHYKNPGH